MVSTRRRREQGMGRASSFRSTAQIRRRVGSVLIGTVDGMAVSIKKEPKIT
jgi:hypothetical protein